MKLYFRCAVLTALCTVAIACGAADAPSEEEIATLVKQSVAAELEDPDSPSEERQALHDALEAASVTRKGDCDAQNTVYVCFVEVTIKLPHNAEQHTQSVVIEMSRGGNGAWKVAE